MTDDKKPGAESPDEGGAAPDSAARPAPEAARQSDSAPPAAAEPAAAPAKPAAVKPVAAKPAAARPKPKPKPPPEPPKGPPDPAPPDGMEAPIAVAAVQDALPGAIEAVSYWVGDWTLIVARERLLEVLEFLKTAEATAFDYCSDVTATDWPPRERRFDLIYCLYSTRLRHRIRVKARVAEDEEVESVTGLWPAANWLEREVFDQFGINIVNHPDLRRILMPDEWQGYPQRKDYPLEGPGELLMENPQDWLRVRNLPDEAADLRSGADAGAGPDSEIE